jgi:HTH-type transcriptional regulator/antitoxin HigA
MKKYENLTPAYAIHPGEMLLDEIEARGMSQAELGKLIGYKRSQLNEVIKGKRAINANLALLLEAVLEIPADFWLKAQNEYELDLAKIEAKPQVSFIEEYKSISAHLDIKYLKKQHLISGNPEEDIALLYELIGNDDLNDNHVEEPALAEHYRLSGKLQHDIISLNTWTAVAKYQAKQVEVSPFDKSLEDDLIFNLKSIFQENKRVLERTKEMLTEYGIKFLFQEKAEKVPVDGMAFWSVHNPAIVMTLRHQRIDNFAFTLLHELGHVFKHIQQDSMDQFIDVEKNPTEKSNQIEHEANEYAKFQLVDRNDWSDFMERTFKFNADAFRLFAKEQGIHPASAYGLYSHETGNYRKPRGIDFKLQ